MASELIHLSSTQINALPKEKTVFFFPVGPLEDHGPHLPVGMDILEATRCCQRAAIYLEETMSGWKGVQMPAAPLGVDSNTTQIAITVRPHVLRDWLVDSCLGLIQAGFFHFVCFSGHFGPKQLTAIEDAGKMIRKRIYVRRFISFLKGKKLYPTFISASSSQVSFKNVLASPFWPDPLEHGGKRDTSVALAILGTLPQMDYQELENISREPARYKRNWMRRRHQLKSYWGNPNEAEAACGEKNLKHQVEDLFPKMKAVWEGTRPEKWFRSWYSILPLNKSFFKAWLLVFWICVFVCGWALLQGALIHF